MLDVIRILKNEYKEKPVVSGFSSPFHVLISCILSLRTKDEVTRKASTRLFEKVKNCEDILKLKNIEELIYPVGFYKTKAKRIKEICKVLIDDYNGKVPCDFNELLKLKGVGKKTAAITMVYGFKKVDYIPVDVHVHVVANRLGWVKTKNADETMGALMKIVPKKYWYDLNELFVKFGQNVCLTVSPFCSRCKVRKYCKRIGVVRNR
ncbi:MAG: endonuclease III [Nanoarchaeota archaeon]|nr:endonuclease III [Nanoarchaeota archaeon]